MTTLVARHPLEPLSMSSIQHGSRRLSARLQEKEDAQPNANGTNDKTAAGNAEGTSKAHWKAPTNNKKRKIDYDEEDDGFIFTRAKSAKTRVSAPKSQAAPSAPSAAQTVPIHEASESVMNRNDVSSEHPKKRRNKMSFSTPKPVGERVVRRSKRLSDENQLNGSPLRRAEKKDDKPSQPVIANRPATATERPKTPRSVEEPTSDTNDEGHSATRIALPFADTPVIRRNKAMREGLAGRGERRSSLGLRGRRASSLIESGNSNALPHSEVEISDFYKHIESEGLPEPRRMRQLLTWCATRALTENPRGSEFENQSAILAARAIQEELLKDFANKSEMSDWFAREDVPAPEVALEERPNPKNIQNANKINELEEQIERLRAERNSLESLLRTPAAPQLSELMPQRTPRSLAAETALLSSSDSEHVASLQSSSALFTDIQTRLNSLATLLSPTIDLFADGVHKIAQYRDAADRVASRALAICADKFVERERDSRRRALQLPDDDEPSPRQDMVNVLRSLSSIDR